MVDDESMRGCCWLLVGLMRQVRQAESERVASGSWGGGRSASKALRSRSLRTKRQPRIPASWQKPFLDRRRLRHPNLFLPPLLPSLGWYELRARPLDALERAASCCGGEGRRGRGALVSRDHSQEGRSQQTRAARANAQTFQEVALLSLALRFAWPTSPSPQPQQEIIAGSHPTFGRHLRTVLVLVLPPACQSASTDPLFLTQPGLTVHLARSQPHLYF